MAEKIAEKPAGGKLVLFNHSRNPFRLKDGPNGEKRMFAVGAQLECVDQAEYDGLKNYKGVGTAQMVAPSLQNRIIALESEKKALTDEVASLKKQLEKFDDDKDVSEEVSRPKAKASKEK